MEEKFKACQEMIRHALAGKSEEMKEIAQEVGVTVQTVRNALNKEDAEQLTETEKKVLMIAARVAKRCEKEHNDFVKKLTEILQAK